jgi:hypothetical protein
MSDHLVQVKLAGALLGKRRGRAVMAGGGKRLQRAE